MNIDLTRSGLEQRKLLLNGVPGNIFSIRPFNLEKYISTFTSESDTLKPKRITREKQLTSLEKILKNPIGKPQTIVISSDPNDLRAKYLAAHILITAIDYYNKNEDTLRRSRLLRPVWHTLLGNFQDKYRDNVTQSKPGLMVFSNVLPNSSAVKLEKLRDLLELYGDVTRVVVTSEDDPIAFANRIKYPINGAVYLKSKRVIKEI